jgi:hydrogenase expression/formation protein HypC
MCLAIPARVIKINKNIAEIESLGVKKKIDISLLPEVKAGDFVIVHAGFAIQIIDSSEALITEGYWKEYFAETGEVYEEMFIEESGEKDDVQ